MIMKHKILTRMLGLSLAAMMAITSIPVNLAAFAGDVGGSGGGDDNGSGHTTNVTDDALETWEVGLRFSLVTDKGGNTEVAKNRWGTYYLDVWADDWDSAKPDYNYVNIESRYSPLPTAKNIASVYASNFDTMLSDAFTKAGGEFRALDSTNILDFSTAFTPDSGNCIVGSGFHVTGERFNTWFMGDTGIIGGEMISELEIFINYIYQNCLKDCSKEQTFLVVEPVVCLRNPVGNCASGLKTAGNRCVASWYGYLEHNIGIGKDPGQAPSVRNRLAMLGNVFLLTDTKSTNEVLSSGKTMKDIMHEVLGVIIPSDYYNSEDTWFFWFGEHGGVGRSEAEHYDNMHQWSGLGMHAYWLKDMISGDPIDSYDIVTNPTNPDPCEEPKSTDEYDNTGDKTIIKTYIDLYRDSKNGDYTKVINQGTYTRKQCSSDVVISDESGVNGGYKVEAWYTSKSDSDGSKVKGSDMLHTKNKVVKDSTDEKVGKKQFSVEGYKEAKGVKANGSQSFSGIKSGTKGCFNSTTDAKRYTREKPLPERIKNEDQQYITLKPDEKTLVILYVREHGYIDSTTGKDGGGGDITTEFDPYKQLKIVKCYGMVNPVTYEVEDEKGTVVWEQKTRNVHITPEDGYRLAEYVYSTRGSSDWNSMTASKWGTVQGTDTDKDKQFYIKGFIDGEKRTILYYKKRKG